MIIESSVTGRQVRFYDEKIIVNGKPKYLGSLRVEIRGPRAIIDSLDSKHFYKNFDLVWDFINLTNNTYIWNCHVTPEAFTAVQRLIGSKYRAEILSVEKMDGHELCWIEVIKR